MLILVNVLCFTTTSKKRKKHANFNKITPVIRQFQAFFATFAIKTKTRFSFKKCVKIKPSIMDKSQHGNFIPEKGLVCNQKRFFSI